MRESRFSRAKILPIYDELPAASDQKQECDFFKIDAMNEAVPLTYFANPTPLAQTTRPSAAIGERRHAPFRP
jgi:hypothetical protein